MARPVRAISLLAAILLAAVAFSPAAGARSDEVPRLDAARLSAAVAAAHTPAAASIARTNLEQGGLPAPGALGIAGTGIPAYAINPDFVRGIPGAPAGRLAYVAVVVTAADGRKATLQVAPQGADGWTAEAALSGADERELAESLPPGAALLGEPQINGWYALEPGKVTLLRASLPQNAVGEPVPLADYQRQVAKRYGDRLPGGPADRKGELGFVRDDPNETPVPGVVWVAAGVLLLCAAAVVLVLRRRAREAGIGRPGTEQRAA
ncbi:hypothetical protein [Amycolatopsis sp. BJA-103]|uniref:hypothetical protein n=1 Tax=Amycolatopsis sp. BJA-103 TaxID=1911175 RepID=UPI000C7892EA|nr:hypothetical protein [Amycolatopsis sp. BJA-103]AUI58366.1 hypothetical protein BKN51_09135 [Amycolatopsis sp. BJA-103]PNE14770.1 hypothetical protein B1H26_32975 [Amycolatopsis sp. BJA-103]